MWTIKLMAFALGFVALVTAMIFGALVNDRSHAIKAGTFNPDTDDEDDGALVCFYTSVTTWLLSFILLCSV